MTNRALQYLETTVRRRKKISSSPVRFGLLLLTTHKTIIATTMTNRAAKIGNTKFKLAKSSRIASSLVRSGSSRAGAIVPIVRKNTY